MMSIGRRLAFTLVLALSGTAMLSPSAHANSLFTFHLYTKTGAYATANTFTYQYSYYPPGSTTPTTWPATPATFATNPQTITVPTVSTTDIRVTFSITHSTGVGQTVILPGNRTVTTPVHLSFEITGYSPVFYSYGGCIPTPCGVTCHPGPCYPATACCSAPCAGSRHAIRSGRRSR